MQATQQVFCVSLTLPTSSGIDNARFATGHAHGSWFLDGEPCFVSALVSRSLTSPLYYKIVVRNTWFFKICFDLLIFVYRVRSLRRLIPILVEDNFNTLDEKSRFVGNLFIQRPFREKGKQSSRCLPHQRMVYPKRWVQTCFPVQYFQE